MEIRNRTVKKALRRLARLSVVSGVLTKAASAARSAAIATLDAAGIVIPTGEGESVDVPLGPGRGTMRITARRPADHVSVNVDLAKALTMVDNQKATIEQLIGCAAAWNTDALVAVFGEDSEIVKFTTTPSDAKPTLAFTPSKDEAVLAAASRFITRIAGKAETQAAPTKTKVAAAA